MSRPEARQVACDLNRPMRGGQQVQREREAAARDRRMLLQTEQLLNADMQGGCVRRFIIEREPVPRRRIEMRWGFCVEADPQRTGMTW